MYLEARLADESRYGEWEALVTDDMHYWVPNGRADYDPATRLSYINDNRTRLATRIRQLQTGLRHAQTPASPMRRLVSNLEIISSADEGVDGRSAKAVGLATEVVAATNQVVFEVNAAATGQLRVWPSRVTYRLRKVDGSWRMAAKTVELLIVGDALPNLAFLI